MLKASSKRKRTAQEMTEFKGKEELEKQEKQETEQQLIQHMHAIENLQKQLADVQKNNQNAEVALKFVQKQLETNAIVQDEEGTLMINTSNINMASQDKQMN